MCVRAQSFIHGARVCESAVDCEGGNRVVGWMGDDAWAVVLGWEAMCILVCVIWGGAGWGGIVVVYRRIITPTTQEIKS